MGTRDVVVGGIVLLMAGSVLLLTTRSGPTGDDGPAAALVAESFEIPAPPIPDDVVDADPELAATIRRFHAAIVERPDDADRWIALGLVYWANSRFELARTCQSVAARLRPSSARAAYHLAMATSACNDLEGSIRHMQRVLELDAGYSPAHWRLGEWLLDAGRVDEAEDAFRGAIRTEPRDPAGHVGLARAMMRRGDVEEGLAILEEVADWTTHNRRYVHHLIGQAHRRLGAVELAERHLTIGSGIPDAWIDPLATEGNHFQRGPHWAMRQAKSMASAGRTTEAIAFLEAEIDEDPDNAGLHNNLAAMLITQGRWDDARAAARRAIERRPNHDEAHLNLAICDFLEVAERPERDETALAGEARALEALAEALRINPSLAAAHGLEGEIRERRAELEYALAAYELANRTCGENTRWMIRAGVLLRRLGQPDAALEPLERACLLTPHNASAHAARIGALLDLGRAAEARLALEEMRLAIPDAPQLGSLAADVAEVEAASVGPRTEG